MSAESFSRPPEPRTAQYASQYQMAETKDAASSARQFGSASAAPSEFLDAVARSDADQIEGRSNVKSLWRYGRASRHLASVWSVRVSALAAGIMLWHLAVLYDLDFFVNFQNVPAPGTVLSSFVSHLGTTEFYTHIGVSIQRITIAYLLATVFGILIGVAMGRSRIARDVILPYVEIIRPIPAVAWIPLAILMWPTEESSIIYITFLGALFPIILNTVHGVEQTHEVLVRAARTLGARRMQIFRHVVLPAALPSIAAGLAIGMGVAWFSLLAGEIISGQYGIGYFTWNAYSLINYPDIVVGMVCIGLLGTGSTYAVRLMTRPFLRWQAST